MSFRFLSPQPSSPVLDVIFVHGLRFGSGSPLTDWVPRGGDASSFWPDWIREDIDGVRVGILSYETAAFKLKGTAMSLDDRGLNVLSELRAEGIGQNPVVFIAHSLGGLVVKEMLIRSSELDPGYNVIANACRGVVFLATPHYGSPGARLLLAARPFVTAAIKTLSDKNPYLTQLTSRYRTWLLNRDVKHLLLRESFLTDGFMIVPPSSSDPGLDLPVIAVDADHRTIAAPETREAFVYKQVKYFLEKVIQMPRVGLAPPQSPAPASGAVPSTTIEPPIEIQSDVLKASFIALERSLFVLEDSRLEVLRDRDAAELLDADHLIYIAENKLKSIDREIGEAQRRLKEIPAYIELEVRADEATAQAAAARAFNDQQKDFENDDIWNTL